MGNMDIVLLLATALGIAVMAYALYWFVKASALSKSNPNLMLSVFLQKSVCSRATGKYVDKYMPKAKYQLILWNGGILKSENMTDEEAMKLLLTAANEIGDGIGYKAALVCK